MGPIDEFLDEKENYLDCIVIVEGVKDKKALEGLGFSHILTLDRPLFEVVESVIEKKVLILTDLDSEGKKLYGKLKSAFSQRGVYVDDKLRNLLFKTELRQIEGLTSYLKKF